MISLRIISFLGAFAALGLGGGCKRAAPAPPAPVGSSTTGESLPSTLVEHEPTWGKLLVGGVQVDKIEFEKIREAQHEGFLPGLADALRKAAESTKQGGCVLRIDSTAPGWIYFSLLHTIETSPLGKRIYLDTGKGIVHIEQTPQQGRTVVALLDSERYAQLISEDPFGHETSEEEVRVERQIRSEPWAEMEGMQAGLAKHWPTHAKGVKRLVVRIKDVNAFSDLAAFVRAADRVRRELPSGERFEIGIAPLIQRVEKPEPPPSVPVRLGPVTVNSGKRDPALFLRVLQNLHHLFRRCYDDFATANKSLHGKGVLTFIVGKNGEVLEVLFKGSLPREAARCVREAGRTIRLLDDETNANIDVEIEFTTPDGGT